MNKVLMKIFRTVFVDVIRECRLWFGIPDIKVLVVKRKKKFLMKYAKLLTPQTDSVNCLALVLSQSQSIIVKSIFLFYLWLVFLLPYRIYGEIKLCRPITNAWDCYPVRYMATKLIRLNFFKN